MEEIDVQYCKRKRLQARFQIHSRQFLHSNVSLNHDICNSDYRKKMFVIINDREKSERQSRLVMELYEQGDLVVEISHKIGLSATRTRAILVEAFARQGKPFPNGHQRKKQLPKQFIVPPLYQEIAEKVKEFYDQGLALSEIAEKLKVDRNTITKSVRHWHEARGLKTPDGRSRRILLREAKNSSGK